MRGLYRARQFYSALGAKPSAAHIAAAAEALSPPQLLLFQSLSGADQVHALRVFEHLRQRGNDDPTVLAAALLHDVGKARCHLSPFERALAVVIGRLAPGLLARWGRGEPRGWRRPFAVALQHPEWGAEMLREIGGSPQLIALVRRHQDDPAQVADRKLGERLRALQSADNRN